MGKGNRFVRRKPRDAKSLRRRDPRRDSYEVAIILGEGEKTEPNYFREMRDDLQLNPRNIQVLDCGGGRDPNTLVDKALEAYEKDPETDRIFLVFDRDNHTTYDKALERVAAYARRKRNPIPLVAITSTPCFEVWLLLHFQYTTRPFDYAVGPNMKGKKRSACDDVVGLLKRHLPKYEKKDQSIYGQTKGLLDQAMVNAECLTRHNRATGTVNPSTRVHRLAAYLTAIAGA